MPPSRPAPRTGLAAILVVTLVSAAIGIWYGMRSPGTYQDDDPDHYYVARQAWSQPELFLDRWAMPVVTLVFAAPARGFGYAGVETTTALLTALTTLFVGLTARRLGLARPWVAAALFASQPMVVELSYSALAEPVGAALLALALWAWYGGRFGMALAVAAWLPLARIEGGVLTVAFLAAGWSRVSWTTRLLTVAPLAAWNLMGWLTSGDPWFVLSLGSTRPLNSLGVLQYARNWIVAVGPVVWFFFAAAMVGRVAATRGERKPTPVPNDTTSAPRFPFLAGAVVAGTLTLLTLLAWEALPFGRSIGFLRHVLVVAPAAALVAAWGFQDWLQAPGRKGLRVLFLILWPALAAVWHSHRLIAHTLVGEGRTEWRWIVAAVLGAAGCWFLVRPPGARIRRGAAVVVAAAACAFTLATVRPIGLDGERATIAGAVEYLRNNHVLDRTVYTNHVWFVFLSGRDRYDLDFTPRLTRAGLEAAVPGDLVLWENHYGPRLYGDVPLDTLLGDPRFQRIFEAFGGPHREFHVVIFQRL